MYLGTFWHITDLHWDPTYVLSADPQQVCASSGQQPAVNAGNFGDYVCDSPWHLINSSIYAMKDILPDPDFIIWTGYASDSFIFSPLCIFGSMGMLLGNHPFISLLSDDTPHVPNEDLGEQAVISIISNLTHIIRQVFPCKYAGFFYTKKKNKTLFLIASVIKL